MIFVIDIPFIIAGFYASTLSTPNKIMSAFFILSYFLISIISLLTNSLFFIIDITVLPVTG
jgi:hypothetical protein